MQPVATTPIIATPQPTTPVGEQPNSNGGGVQGVVADFIRGSVAGYATATKQTAVQADKAAIHPFETVSTATGLLKSKTANVKYVNKATGLLHTIGGFALLIMSANASGTLKAPGDTAKDLSNRVADMIDGKDTAQGWSLGWGVVTDSETGAATVSQSGIGSALSGLGMK